MNIKLKPFQREFLRAVENPAFDTVCLSGPRALGKTFLAAKVLERCLTPGDPLFQAGKTYVLGAASLDQARMTYGFIRAALEDTGEYRWIDSATRLGATHVKSNTKLRAISSKASTSLGLVNTPVVCLDEPGALEHANGRALADSLFSAQGKPGSGLKLILIGTLAPMATQPGHWWYDVVHGGTHGKTHVQFFKGDVDTWDSWKTIRRANPLVMVDQDTREKLLEERDLARVDSYLKARFLSFRLNIPSQDESETLLTVDDWALLADRPTTEREGPAIIGVDLGAGRAWSAAVAMWPTGRIETFALAPGLPDLGEQERRDHVPAGLYRQLYDDGLLLVDEGLRVQTPARLWHEILDRWGFPQLLVADRFREGDLMDASDGLAPLEPRVARWSEASADIRALRKGVRDGPFNIGTGADLLGASLAVSRVKNDDGGNVRLVKDGTNNTARDDVAAALVLVAGAWERLVLMPPTPATYSGMVDP